MYVAAFNGSGRKDGNTAILLKAVIEELAKEGIAAELVQLAGHPVTGCTACRRCFERADKRCAVEGDIVNDCIEKMIRADGVLLGSPVYYGDLTAGMKALIERSGFVAKANGDLFRRKAGAAVISVRRAGAMHAFDSINHFFTITQMIIPGADYWNIGIGRDVGEVKNDSEGLKTMQVLGQNMAWLLKRLSR
jgi:multimeric flavodoxin WrbA